MVFKSSKSIMQVWSLIFCSKTLNVSSKLSFPSARFPIFCSRWIWEFLTSCCFSRSRNMSYLVSAEKISSSGILSSKVPSMSLINMSLSLMVIPPEACSSGCGSGAAGGCGAGVRKKLSAGSMVPMEPSSLGCWDSFALKSGSPSMPPGTNSFTLRLCSAASAAAVRILDNVSSSSVSGSSKA